MGKSVEKVKKKKGRPSLLDLQKRNLKQQQEEEHRKQQLQQQQQLRRSQQNPNPNNSSTPVRRSTRRNPNPDASSPTSDDDDQTGDADEEEDVSTGKRRREKKLKLVHKLPGSSVNSGSLNSGSDSNPEDESADVASHKKRRIEAIGDRSGQRKDVGEKQDGAPNPTSAKQDIKLDDGPSTPLPDKKLLLFILDRLQKKDRYSVFAEPVDPEELPDYHEIIEHPMDFSTIRKKLTNGAYANLEQFEKDVFLLCSNAMQYNAPDTIYFRQARTIQELATKNFENLRQDGDSNEPEVKIVRRGRPPTKHLKKPMDKPSQEGAISDCVPTILDTGGESSSQPNYDLRKNNYLSKYASSDPVGRFNPGSRQGEVYISWSTEKYDRADEMLGSMSKGISMKHGKKQIILDENKRHSYNLSSPSAGMQDPTSHLTTYRGDKKHLIPVGLHTEYGYARSLARFAAKLGPVAWKVACKKIERCLPAGVKFGPGWVGENDTISQSSVHQSPSSVSPLQMPDCNGTKPSEDQKGTNSSENQVNSHHPSGTKETMQPLNSSSMVSTKPGINGINGAYGFNFPTQMGKLTRPAMGNNKNLPPAAQDRPSEVKCENSSTVKSVDCCLPSPGAPPDLNEGFQSPGASSRRTESVQPDLALQLG